MSLWGNYSQFACASNFAGRLGWWSVVRGPSDWCRFRRRGLRLGKAAGTLCRCSVLLVLDSALRGFGPKLSRPVTALQQLIFRLCFAAFFSPITRDYISFPWHASCFNIKNDDRTFFGSNKNRLSFNRVQWSYWEII